MFDFPVGIIPSLVLWGTVLVIVAVALIIFFAARRQRAVLEAWDQLSLRTGLLLERGKGIRRRASLSGDYRRRPLTLTTYVVDSGESSAIYTLISAGVQNSAGGFFQLSPAGILSKLGEALGIQDVKIGDDAFDQRYVVKSKPPEFALGLLGESDMLRHDLMAKVKKNAVIKLEGRQLTYTCIGQEKDVDYLEALFNLLCDIADRVDGSAESEEEF